ncbi:MAG: nucleotidyltransferase domain-containing protein [Lentisphaeria bacterium]|nr:nucleotidyltransferase domain-containing protein [Lentisphaeria bacterium]
MHNKIIQTLKELERKEDCKILFAAESGSRAWGFASPDSDYDIRVIYVKPEAWYWDISAKKSDTFAAMLPGDLDISAWELRKTLQLFSKCNPSLNEWLGSPIIYYAEEAFFAEMKRLLPLYFNPIRAGHHYLALAENSWATLNENKEITLKKLFYALRGLFCAMWSANFRTMPPTEFNKLLIPELLVDEILQLIPELKKQKQQANEKAVLPLPETLYEFYIAQKEQTLQLLGDIKYQHSDNSELNNLLRTSVNY